MAGPRRLPTHPPRVPRVVNETDYPDREVVPLVQRAATLDPGPVPRTIEVKMRRSKRDSRLGFTPYDRSAPTTIWVEPAGRYPQPGADSWQDEVWQTELHEVHHYRRLPECQEGCDDEAAAERYAQVNRRRRPRKLAWRRR